MRLFPFPVCVSREGKQQTHKDTQNNSQTAFSCKQESIPVRVQVCVCVGSSPQQKLPLALVRLTDVHTGSQLWSAGHRKYIKTNNGRRKAPVVRSRTHQGNKSERWEEACQQRASWSSLSVAKEMQRNYQHNQLFLQLSFSHIVAVFLFSLFVQYVTIIISAFAVLPPKSWLTPSTQFIVL